MTTGPEPVDAGTPPADLEGWHRLHPLSPLVRGGRAIAVLLVVAVPRLLSSHGDLTGLIGDAGLAVVVLVAGVVSWLVTRWRVEGADLRIERGLLRRSSERYPLRQLQAIDVVATGVARVLGLAELRLRMAGGGGGRGRLSCLPAADARQLRVELLRLSASTAGEGAPSGQDDVGDATVPAVPGVEEPERRELVLRVGTGRLVASLLLTAPGLVAVVYFLGFVVAVVASPDTAGRTLSGGIVAVVGVATALWRRFNGEYHQTVERSPGGLHLASGLVQTTSETLAPERVQVLRVVEPLLWRPFGWCRVEAAVAGKATRQEDRSEGARRRALLPVGSYAEAYAVLALVLPDLRVTPTKPPPRARWKTLLSYHRLSVGSNDSCVTTTSGRLRRVSHWVPLAKVQSIRETQGPLQRLLHLATVHLDTAGPRSRAALRDRDQTEAAAEVERLPALCAAARRVATAR